MAARYKYGGHFKKSLINRRMQFVTFHSIVGEPFAKFVAHDEPDGFGIWQLLKRQVEVGDFVQLSILHFAKAMMSFGGQGL